jgi:hypothetical protein
MTSNQNADEVGKVPGTSTFAALPVGSRLKLNGQFFVKRAVSLAEDEQHTGYIFFAQTLVEAQESAKEL